ncbi:CAP domain-containing protein [Tenacibaculum sp. AHE15PA]|uniref:CAP domain-containing protein n=1 Tax=Tenacibaculum sp. AHE15PA TaxID=2745566 RepID=UPI0021032A81|nr:CAP domain-containing protein [Tenacibaculum sp. AHE15PA]
MADIAIEHTQYMIDKNKISHDNFDTRFIEVRNLVNAVSFGENVASRQRNAQEVVTVWLNSPGHRENIEGNYTHTGIGIKKDSKNNYYFTQLFYAK